jgi:hypothetical protein
VSYYCRICPVVIEEDDIDLCPQCMHSELIKAGWVHCGGSTYSAEDGSFWRGPVGAWREMKRRAEPTCKVCGGLGSIEEEDGVWICPCNKKH